MSIVLDNKEFGEVRDVKGCLVGSIGEVASTVMGSANTLSSGNVGSKGNVEDPAQAGSLGIVPSLNNFGESAGSLVSVLSGGSLNKVGDERNLVNLENATSTTALNIESAPTVYRQYKYRYVIMFLYFLVSNASGITGPVCAPIITNLQSIYGVSQTVINLSSLLSMIVYIPATIPGNYILDVYGIKIGVLIGTALMVAGIWVRMLATSSFTWVLLGQLLAALGSPLLCNCPQKISAYWTAPKGRTMFTVLLMLSGVVGSSIGTLLPGIMVGDETDPVKGKALFMRLLLIEAIVGTVLCAPLFFFFREKPPTPPSASAEAKRESCKEGIKSLLKNKSFLWLLGQQGCVLGAINSLATVMQSLVNPFNINQVQAAGLGIIVLVASVTGSLVFGIYVQKVRRFRVPIIWSGFVGLAAYGIFTGVLFTENFYALAIVSFVLGFVLSPSGPLALEFACELTFPVGEALAGGTILSVIQVFCPAQTFIIGGIMGMGDQKKAVLWVLIMLMIFMAVGIFCSFQVTENLKRSAHDKAHDNKVHDEAKKREELERENQANQANRENPGTPCPLVHQMEESPKTNNP